MPRVLVDVLKAGVVNLWAKGHIERRTVLHPASYSSKRVSKLSNFYGCHINLKQSQANRGRDTARDGHLAKIPLMLNNAVYSVCNCHTLEIFNQIVGPKVV